MRRFFICLIFLPFYTAQAGQIYQWVDENGITQFSSRPPAEQKSKAKKVARKNSFFNAPRQPYAEIDKHALNAPDEATASITTLAAYLSSTTRDQRKIARALYRWVTRNVFYDGKGLVLRGKLGPQNAEYVLQKRIAVCEGYARLFEALGKAAGLETVMVVGYSKGYGNIPGERFGEKSAYTGTITLDGRSYSGTEIKHAWNAIKIDGKWHLIDTTWGAGYLEGPQYRRKFTDYYFLTPPKQFIYDHFPDQARWQLLDKPLSLRDYENLVVLGRSFFHHKLTIGSHPKGVIDVGNHVKIRLGAPPGVWMLAELLALDERIRPLGREYVGLRRGADDYYIEAVTPEAGRYLLRIYVGKKGKKATLVNGLNYTINSVRGMDEHQLPVFPEEDFYHAGLNLGTDKRRLIFADTKTVVSLSGPADTLLSASLYEGKRQLSDEHIFLQGHGKTHEIHASWPKPGDYTLRIYAAPGSGNDSRLPLVLSYKIKAKAAGTEKFPEIYRNFYERRAYLHSPLQKQLRSFSKQSFAVTVPGAEAVIVGTQQQWFPLRRGGGDYFSAAVPVPSGEFAVYAKFPDEGKDYAGLLKYHGH